MRMWQLQVSPVSKMVLVRQCLGFIFSLRSKLGQKLGQDSPRANVTQISHRSIYEPTMHKHRCAQLGQTGRPAYSVRKPPPLQPISFISNQNFLSYSTQSDGQGVIQYPPSSTLLRRGDKKIRALVTSPGGLKKKKLAQPARPTKFERGLIMWKILIKIIPIPHSFYELSNTQYTHNFPF